VFVTLGRRFWGQFGASVGPEWDEMFGSTAWRAVSSVAGAPAQARFLADCYRTALLDVGFKFLLDFELVDERGEHLYLIHATTNVRGLEKMKDAIWAVDPVSGAAFRDPRDLGIGQETLGLDWQPNVAPLKPLILEWLDTGPQTVEALRQRAFLETVYKPMHATTAIRRLVDEGLLRRSPPEGRLVGATVVAKP
jgi:hypothetical protein